MIPVGRGESRWGFIEYKTSSVVIITIVPYMSDCAQMYHIQSNIHQRAIPASDAIIRINEQGWDHRTYQILNVNYYNSLNLEP